MQVRHSVGLLIQASGGPDDPDYTRLLFLGSCFAFRSPRHFLTAGHCVGDLDPDQIAVAVSEVQPLRPALRIHRHPEADVAIIEIVGGAAPVEPFWGHVSNLSLGEDFFAFGYPEAILGPQASMPTARLFKGHYQRFLNHRSFMGYQYKAGEMSIPAPAGLSGGPIFRPGAPQMVTAVAAENFESTTTLEAVEEIVKPGVRSKTEYQRVISYGLGALLYPLDDWLNAHVPQRDLKTGESQAESG